MRQRRGGLVARHPPARGGIARALPHLRDRHPRRGAARGRGVYPLDRVAGYSKAYQQAGGRASLADYYTAAYGGALFDKRLKAHIAFLDHSLATDSVFSEVELVSCRNVLIYFDRELQARAVGLFHDALPPLGFLGIGSRESLRFSAHAGAFEEFSAPERIYRKRARAA
jgi:chemotaxis protein methyltransferase CheR